MAKKLKQRMTEKKVLQSKRDAEDAKTNEAMRRKGGIDQSEIKARMELAEVNKAAAERARGTSPPPPFPPWHTLES